MFWHQFQWRVGWGSHVDKQISEEGFSLTEQVILRDNTECPAIQLHSDTVIHRQHQIPQTQSQSYKTAPAPYDFDANPNHLCFWMTGYKSEVPTTFSLCLISLLGEAHKAQRKHIYLLDHLFTIKWCNSGTDKLKTCRGQGKEEELSVHALSKLTARQYNMCSPNGKSEPLSFGGFCRASLHSCSWLNHWPLAIDSTSESFSEVRCGTESSNPSYYNTGLLATSCHPKMGSKSHLSNIRKTRLWLSSFRKLQMFQEFHARNGVEDQYLSWYKPWYQSSSKELTRWSSKTWELDPVFYSPLCAPQVLARGPLIS